MQQKSLANTPIFPIGLGCMGMSEFYGDSDDQASLALLDKAYELGVNFWDSADTYGFGHNEALLGEWLKTRDTNHQLREQLVIATKFGIVRQPGQYERYIDNSPDYIRYACDASLKRLQTDYIDVYYCHRRNPDTPLEEMMHALGHLLDTGKIRGIGLSEVNAKTIRRAHAIHPLSAVQSEYSLWTREVETEIIPVCAELGIQFVAYSPLGRAFLTGKVDTSTLTDNDFRRILPRFHGQAAVHNQTLVDTLSQLANTWQLSNAQLCLAWMLNKYAHVIPIAGTRREHYLIENSAAADVILTPSQIARLDKLFHTDSITGKRYPDAGWSGIEQ
ncbi:aldo/keto reductase [Suttonella sp. R2A3]|uniref:aldo/keto reductase n=1 Tax=Suttonella sp. R2A3 TaxID=2908648 RepID=UPI001F334D49|nr:aldo/keto reductase [Suttonella sp. R2A3]UJF24968.1 aldo/keto reductase [Suttonella sp. R2A3]